MGHVGAVWYNCGNVLASREDALNTFRKVFNLLSQGVALAAVIAMIVLTAMNAASLQMIVMLLGAGLMTLALAEQVSGGG
jgi:hypothetical protein